MSTQYSSTGPHIHSQDSIARTMWTIVVSLLPASVVGVWMFGPYSLYLIFGTAVAAALIERPLSPQRYSSRLPLGDGSAFVGGMILGLSLAPTTAWWIPIVGAFFLVVVGKHVFGGIGNNIFNPALVSRAILLLTWPHQITQWVAPFDATTSATPLAGLEVGYLSLFLGNIPGSVGETSVVALLIGAALLLARGYISWRVPVSVLAGGALGAVLFGLDPLFTLLSGSLMFGAIFMATDMVTSPTGKTSHLVYGVGCGLLTVVIRRFTHYPEGITFAFLLMNGVAYLMDRIGADPIFGQVEERRRRVFRAAAVVGTVALAALVSAVGYVAQSAAGSEYADAALAISVRSAFPESQRMAPEESYDPEVSIFRIYRDRTLMGYYARTQVDGYGEAMVVEAALAPTGELLALNVADNNESAALGTRVRSRPFLAQFLGFQQDTRDEIPAAVEALSGATISSRAVIAAAQKILAARDETAWEESDVEPLPSVADGTYSGTGEGYGGAITVEVEVSGGRVTAVTVVRHGETSGIGDRAFGPLTNRLIEAQSLDVEAVSGATATSRGFLAAVENALDERGSSE